MDLIRIFKVIIRWWWLVLIPILVVGAYILITYQPVPTSYQVVMSFVAGSEPSGLSVDYDRYYAWLSSEYIANGLADIARTGAFAEAVSEQLQQMGMSIDARAVQAAIASDNAQSILVIYLTWRDPAELTKLAEAVSLELTENGGSYYPQMRDLGITAQNMDTPAPVALPPSLKAQLVGPGLRLMLATAVGLGLAFLTHYLDPFVRDPEELESLKVPVLVCIPRKS